MASKNKVEDVKALSNDLLRGFEATPTFQLSSDTSPEESLPELSAETQPEEHASAVEAQPTGGEETTPKTVAPKTSTNSKRAVQKNVSADEQKTNPNRRPFNLYLSEDDIKYMQDLGKVLGLSSTQIIRSWIGEHRRQKNHQVQEALKQLEERQKLL
jgi:hypothetical protein